MREYRSLWGMWLSLRKEGSVVEVGRVVDGEERGRGSEESRSAGGTGGWGETGVTTGPRTRLSSNGDIPWDSDT
jgi:hypothetical protein